MRARSVWFVLLLWAYLGVLPARGEQIVPPRDSWSQAATAIDSGDVDTAFKKASEAVDTGKNLGIRTFPLYAEAAAAYSRQTQKVGAKAASDWGAKVADQLDPTSPTVAFSKADGAVERVGWGDAATYSARGLLHVFSNRRATILSRADGIVVAMLALGLTAVIFGIALFIRYGRAMAHDFREILGRRFRGGSVTVLAFALLFLPLFLWLGPGWLIFYWFIIFFGYAEPVERVMIVLLSLLLAAAPILLDLGAHWAAGVDSPVVESAVSTVDQAYNPENLRRLQEVLPLVSDSAELHVLLGNLQLQEANEQQATNEYLRAIQVHDNAGAHVNIGNIRFLNNDLSSASTEYQKAQTLDPHLAIAYYNDSIASGDQYKFTEQAQKIELAKRIDRAGIEKLLSNPPAQKIVWYNPPISTAWQIADTIARQKTAASLFGNYSWFDIRVSAVNSLTIGALLALVLAVALWIKRRRTGFAGACIKCGRTFCHRCKSSRESATYCTQCIHIYLKRDGVSLDTKKAKIDEVNAHVIGMTRRNRLFATFLPGSAQLLEGRTIGGMLGLYVFLLFVSLALLAGRLAPVLTGTTVVMLVRVVALVIVVLLWFSLSTPVYRRRYVG